MRSGRFYASDFLGVRKGDRKGIGKVSVEAADIRKKKEKEVTPLIKNNVPIPKA